jgi:hypothetical protein
MSTTSHPIVDNGKKEIAVRQLPPMKLKDSNNKNRIVINLKDVFGFLPEIMIIDKVIGKNSTIQIAAVIPQEKHEKNRKKRTGVDSGKKKAVEGTGGDR